MPLNATAGLVRVESEEDERAFVHRGIWISNKGLDNTMPAIVNCICMKSVDRLSKNREEEEEEENEQH